MLSVKKNGWNGLQPEKNMNIKVSVFGPDIIQNHSVRMDHTSPTLRDLAATVLNQTNFPWYNILINDQTLMKGYTALVNGRNIGSLEGFGTRLQENDEVIFTVVISGG
jgi:hypothetical protein